MKEFDRRITMLTLGVADLQRSTAFYGRLGWARSVASQDGVTFIALDGIVLSLFGRKALAEDAGLEEGIAGGFPGFSMAYNVGSEAAVDETVQFACECGATLVKPPRKVFWGGYSGYVADPDGFLWEVAFNPFMPLDDTGCMVLDR
ncbi:VOC family protein [Martelella alba]|uniref:VOC family protein n=1 Tax=Martelella alba TaxID=2590451 RepID=A0A506UI50_9HYPH|nr:VOC family protein [Martelella alba]TPW33001.1 VOC family protein [Martelella alba]